MFPPMMPGMGPMMPGVPGTPFTPTTVAQQRAALEAQQQEMLRVKAAAELALSQIDEELKALESDATDEVAADASREALVANDAAQLRAMTAQVDQQAQALAQQARYDRLRMSNQNLLNDRRQWVAGGEEFGRPVM